MYYIGVDLGGTNIAIGIVNEDFEIVKKGSTPTKPERGADAIVEDMAESQLKKVQNSQSVKVVELLVQVQLLKFLTNLVKKLLKLIYKKTRCKTSFFVA